MNQGWASGNSIHEPHPAESNLSRNQPFESLIRYERSWGENINVLFVWVGSTRQTITIMSSSTQAKSSPLQKFFR